MNIREYRAFFVLVPVAVLSAWLANIAEKDEKQKKNPLARTQDYFAITYTKLELDALGQPDNYLRAAKMMHFSDTDITILEQPWMTFYNDQEPPWELRSESAQISPDGKDILMQGEVRVERAEAPGIRPLLVNTSNLRVKPEISYAETDEWAELISKPDITTGTGMQVTFKKPIHLQLLYDVKGRYETN